MPAVKPLHQASDSNTKPEYIMAHSCQALALLVKVGASVQAVPLTARIHDGVVLSNRDRRRLLDKLLLLLAALRLPEPVLLLADAYYACGKIIAGLLDRGGHLISRLKKNACAYTVPPRPRRPGRASQNFTAPKSACAIFSPGPSRPGPARSTPSRPSPCARAVATCSGVPPDASSALWPSLIPTVAKFCSCPPTSRSLRPRSSGSTPCASTSRSVSSRRSTASAPGRIISGCAR